MQGDAAAVRDYAEQGLAAARSIHLPRWICSFLLWLGDAEAHEGRCLPARKRYLEVLREAERTHFAPGIGVALRRLAALSALAGDPERAAVLFGAALSTAGADTDGLIPPGRFAPSVSPDAVRSVLGDEAFSTAQYRGGALSPEQRLALAETVPVPEGQARGASL